MKKKCPRCKQLKSLEQFYRDPKRKHGRRPYCKRCENELRKISRQTNQIKNRTHLTPREWAFLRNNKDLRQYIERKSYKKTKFEDYRKVIQRAAWTAIYYSQPMRSVQYFYIPLAGRAIDAAYQKIWRRDFRNGVRLSELKKIPTWLSGNRDY